MPIAFVTSTNDWIDVYPLRHECQHPSLVVYQGTAHLGRRRLTFDVDNSRCFYLGMTESMPLTEPN